MFLYMLNKCPYAYQSGNTEVTLDSLSIYELRHTLAPEAKTTS